MADFIKKVDTDEKTKADAALKVETDKQYYLDIDVKYKLLEANVKAGLVAYKAYVLNMNKINNENATNDPKWDAPFADDAPGRLKRYTPSGTAGRACAAKFK